MADNISIIGLVATVPEHRRVRDNIELTTFRLASQQRHFDRGTQTWVNGETNWYTVSTFRHLARNVLESVHKGDRVVVTGRLRIRRWENGEKNGTAVDIEAESVGQDLAWGTARYTRTPAKEAVPATTTDPLASADDTDYFVDAGPTATVPSAEMQHADAGPIPVDWDVTQPGLAGSQNPYHPDDAAREADHEIAI